MSLSDLAIALKARPEMSVQLAQAASPEVVGKLIADSWFNYGLGKQSSQPDGSYTLSVETDPKTFTDAFSYLWLKPKGTENGATVYGMTGMPHDVLVKVTGKRHDITVRKSPLSQTTKAMGRPEMSAQLAKAQSASEVGKLIADSWYGYGLGGQSDASGDTYKLTVTADPKVFADAFTYLWLKPRGTDPDGAKVYGMMGMKYEIAVKVTDKKHDITVRKAKG